MKGSSCDFCSGEACQQAAIPSMQADLPPDSIFNKSFVIYSSFRTSLIINQRRNTPCDWAIRYRKNFSHFLSKHVHSSASLLVDGWVMGQDDEDVYVPWCRAVIKVPQISTILDLSNSRLGRKWTECIDKEWLRDIEKKEKEIGKLLE